MDEDKVFVESVVKFLVAHPEDVRVDRTIDERGVLLTLHINQADMGQIIGRKGQTVGAVRTLLRVVGAKHNARVNLKIYEPEGARPAKQAEIGQQEVNTDVVDDLKL
jgi:predicted RNA-binding protein YlqC (UPF0109 family)